VPEKYDSSLQRCISAKALRSWSTVAFRLMRAIRVAVADQDLCLQAMEERAPAGGTVTPVPAMAAARALAGQASPPAV